jgi:hypothetical protein
MHRTASVLVPILVTACCSLPAAAGAQQPPGAPETLPRAIHVNANASVQRAPDRAVIQVAVETVAETAGEASRQNAQAMDRVLAALRRLGIPRSDIRTLRIELLPRYDQGREAREPEIVGYRAVNQVIITVDSIPVVGGVVDAAVGAGANRVTGINFELRDPEAAYHEALQLAIEKARAEARVIADALGEPLGPALQVQTGGYSPPYRPMPMGGDAMRMEAIQSMPPPVEPGEIDVRAHVSITFRLGS